MNVDDIIRRLGDFGRYQKTIYLLLLLHCPLICFHSMSLVFLVLSPPKRCSLFEDDTYAIQDDNHQRLIDLNIPKTCTKEDCVLSQCTTYSDVMYLNDTRVNDTGVVKCHKWVYDKTYYDISFVTEYDLVCDKSYLRGIPATSYMVGFMVGVALFSGFLSDRFGRKRMMMVALICLGISGILSAWVPGVYSFIILRAVIGASQTSYTSAFIIGMEFVGPSKRVITGIVINIAYAAGYIITDAMAYGLRNWRHLLTAGSLQAFLFIPYIWLIPESVRWLVANGRDKEAMAIIQKAARTNGVTLPDEMTSLALLSNDEIPVKSNTKAVPIIDLLRKRVLLFRYLILMFNWFTVSMTYYGLSWNSGDLSGNLYVNFLLVGAIEIPAYILVILTLNRFGRKRVHCFSMIVTGLSLISCMFVVIFSNKGSSNWILVLLTCTGKFCISASYSIIYLYTTELFPTVVRATGLGMCSTCARIGSTLAPNLLTLVNLLDWQYRDALPSLIFGCFSITAGCLSLLLPETANRKLPETIEDAININKNQNMTVALAKDDENKQENGNLL